MLNTLSKQNTHTVSVQLYSFSEVMQLKLSTAIIMLNPSSMHMKATHAVQERLIKSSSECQNNSVQLPVAKQLRHTGRAIAWQPHDASGSIHLKFVRRLLTPDTAYTNHHSGCQPVKSPAMTRQLNRLNISIPAHD